MHSSVLRQKHEQAFLVSRTRPCEWDKAMNGTVFTCNGFVLRREPLPRVLLIMLANGTTVLKGLCEQTQPGVTFFSTAFVFGTIGQYYDMSCQARARAWACPSSVRRLQEQGLLRRRCRPGHFQLPVSGQNAADNSDASDHLFAIELDASISASSLLRLQR